MTTFEKIDAITRIIRRQSEQADNILENALSNASFDSNYYGEVRGIAHSSAALALKQKEESGNSVIFT